MAISYSFIDNTIYGPDDINDITRSLTGAGIAPFVSKDSYNVSDLNVMTSALVASGVQLDGCKCSVKSADTEEMTVAVAQGIIFFESGVRLTVDSDGYTVSVVPNTAGYVYACYSPSLQKADIVFAAQLPTDGEFVLLAEVLADGTTIDKRIYAKSKIATMGKNVSLKENFVPMEKTFIRESEGTRYFAVASVPGVDLSKFNYALVLSSEITGPPLGVPYGCLCDVNNGKTLFSLKGSYDPPSAGNVFLEGRYLSLWYCTEIFNNELCIVAKCSISNGGEKYIDNSIFSNYIATFM